MITGHWGLSSPRDGVVRFTEHNDLVKFYEVAKEVGILVIVRVFLNTLHNCQVSISNDRGRTSMLKRLEAAFPAGRQTFLDLLALTFQAIKMHGLHRT